MNSFKLQFPIKEVFEDYADRKRSFTINLYESPIGGYLLIAKEDVKGDDNGGYEFEAYSETNVGIALSDLKSKIKKTSFYQILGKVSWKKLSPK